MIECACVIMNNSKIKALINIISKNLKKYLYIYN